MKFYLAVIFLIVTLVPPKKEVQRKVISDDEFNYTFYVLTENTATNNTAKFYHWFKSGEIHSSQGSSSGNLLHGVYTKSYKDNDLAEQGNFKKGLKDEVWKRWYENGQLYEISKWDNGFRTGRYVQFSEDGQVLVRGNFKDNRKHGQWIDEALNDTLYFAGGNEIEKPKKYTRKPFKQRSKLFFKKLFSKKEKDSLLPNPKTEQNKPDTNKDRKTKKKRVRKKKERNKEKKEK